MIKDAVPPDRHFLYLWQGRLFWATPYNINTRHAHFSTTILLSLDDTFELAVGNDAYVAYAGAVVRSNQPLSVHARHANFSFHVDPDMAEHHTLWSLLGNRSVAPVPGSAFQHLRSRLQTALTVPLSCHDAQALFQDVLDAIAPPQRHSRPSLDPRIARVAQRLRAELPDQIPVAELAASVHLSPSWLMHLFKRELGIPIRQYLRYLRVRKAACLMAMGWPLTDMSLAAGFSDQAHATRTVQRTYGLNPSHFSSTSHCQVCDTRLVEDWNVRPYRPASQ